MKQLLEFLPLVLFFSAYQLSGETLNIGSWSHTFGTAIDTATENLGIPERTVDHQFHASGHTEHCRGLPF